MTGSLLSLKTPSEMTCPYISIAERERERERERESESESESECECVREKERVRVLGMGVVFLYRAPFIQLLASSFFVP